MPGRRPIRSSTPRAVAITSPGASALSASSSSGRKPRAPSSAPIRSLIADVKLSIPAKLAVALAAILLAHLIDPWFYQHFRVDNIYGKDWGRALRVMGFLPLWLTAALALALH